MTSTPHKPPGPPTEPFSPALRFHALTRDSVRGDLPVLLREAGFAGVAETRHARTLYSTLTHIRAARPA